MALSTFFDVNFPYGIYINEEGAAMIFNREYMPVGINTMNFYTRKETGLSSYEQDLPIYTHYDGLTENFLVNVAAGGTITRYDNGKIKLVFLYNHQTNPTVDSTQWDTYFKKLKLLSALKRTS